MELEDRYQTADEYLRELNKALREYRARERAGHDEGAREDVA